MHAHEHYLAIIFGLAGGICYAMGAYLQHKVAQQQPLHLSLSPRLVVQLVQAPLWTLGFLFDLGAFACEAIALKHGSITVVQPLLLSGLLFSLPVSAAFDHQRLGRAEWISGGVTAAGLTLFIAFGHPRSGRVTAPWDEWLLAFVVIAAVVGIALLLAHRREGSQKAFFLAVATAACYGLTAALTKSMVAGFDHGIVSVLTSWTLYADIGVGALGLVLNQSAFQAGHLAASLPTVGVCAPVASIIVGRLVLNEHFGAHTPLQIGLTAIGLVAMLGGAVRLARSPLVTHEDLPSEPKAARGGTASP